MSYKARIKWRGLSHPVQKWGKDRNVKAGTLFPAPCPIADKPGGKKGKPVPYNNAKLKELLEMNGGNMKVFRFATRIGGWLFNTVSNKHLIGKLKGLLPKWLGKFADSYVPYPLKNGQIAFAEKIYCDSNVVTVEKVVGKYAYLAPGNAYLVQVGIGTGVRAATLVRWRVSAGWIENSMLEKI